ncbi:MAG: TVP38/TMEM64 family protein [Verrucomicrobiales bacterium]
MRLLLIFLLLAVLTLVPFLIWGERFGRVFDGEGAIAWLESYGQWAWAAGIALLVLDLFLPLPSTVVMSALGYVYGLFWGGLLASAGSFLAGTLAYGLCRFLGRDVAVRIAGERGMAESERLFAAAGGWIVALSRWLPLLPEVIACMAGLARMPLRAFLLALGCGCLPMGFTFAAVGHAGANRPLLAIGLSVGLPPLIWICLRPLLRTTSERGRPGGGGGAIRR